jgi:hypothetical protein
MKRWANLLLIVGVSGFVLIAVPGVRTAVAAFARTFVELLTGGAV